MLQVRNRPSFVPVECCRKFANHPWHRFETFFTLPLPMPDKPGDEEANLANMLQVLRRLMGFNFSMKCAGLPLGRSGFAGLCPCFWHNTHPSCDRTVCLANQRTCLSRSPAASLGPLNFFICFSFSSFLDMPSIFIMCHAVQTSTRAAPRSFSL
jgi:hypothetical protein